MLRLDVSEEEPKILLALAPFGEWCTEDTER